MHLHWPTISYQLQHWICFFFKIWFFFSRTEQKKTIDSDFIRGTEYPKIWDKE